MKALLLALMLFAMPAHADDRATAIKRFVDDMRAGYAESGHDPNNLRITDTGDSLQDGQPPCPDDLGNCPIVSGHVKGGSVECLIAVHPTKSMHAILICAPRDPEVDS